MTAEPFDRSRYWTPNDSRCQICGVPFRHDIPETEAYDPESDTGSVVCHARCAKAYGLELS